MKINTALPYEPLTGLFGISEVVTKTDPYVSSCLLIGWPYVFEVIDTNPYALNSDSMFKVVLIKQESEVLIYEVSNTDVMYKPLRDYFYFGRNKDNYEKYQQFYNYICEVAIRYINVPWPPLCFLERNNVVENFSFGTTVTGEGPCSLIKFNIDPNVEDFLLNDYGASITTIDGPLLQLFDNPIINKYHLTVDHFANWKPKFFVDVMFKENKKIENILKGIGFESYKRLNFLIDMRLARAKAKYKADVNGQYYEYVKAEENIINNVAKEWERSLEKIGTNKHKTETKNLVRVKPLIYIYNPDKSRANLVYTRLFWFELRSYETTKELLKSFRVFVNNFCVDYNTRIISYSGTDTRKVVKFMNGYEIKLLVGGNVYPVHHEFSSKQHVVDYDLFENWTEISESIDDIVARLGETTRTTFSVVPGFNTLYDKVMYYKEYYLNVFKYKFKKMMKGKNDV